MSWQDRDYAREQPPVDPYAPAPPRGSGTVGRYGIVDMLIGVNVIVYLASAFIQPVGLFIYGWGTLVPGSVLGGQIWRLITAQYLHANAFHILLNMIGLHFLGRPLESLWSAKKFFAIYTLCGLAGNVFYVFLATKQVIGLWDHAVGASGCIFGLLGIVAVMYPHATVYVYFLFPIRIRTAAFAFGVLAVLRVISRGYNYGGEACHLAGLIFGVWWAVSGEEWWNNTEWRIPWRKKRQD